MTKCLLLLVLLRRHQVQRLYLTWTLSLASSRPMQTLLTPVSLALLWTRSIGLGALPHLLRP
uniref:Uncharacterized protein n=1 Tax=uncultured marine virus TaxID=186617 RepID=A0A0F7L7W8_9VIRU|nr:hypothetical protein [uncultured marine virus]